MCLYLCQRSVTIDQHQQIEKRKVKELFWILKLFLACLLSPWATLSQKFFENVLYLPHPQSLCLSDSAPRSRWFHLNMLWQSRQSISDDTKNLKVKTKSTRNARREKERKKKRNRKFHFPIDFGRVSLKLTNTDSARWPSPLNINLLAESSPKNKNRNRTAKNKDTNLHFRTAKSVLSRALPLALSFSHSPCLSN